MSVYDAIARVYDPWSASVTEDVEFYVEEARASGGPVVELACGTGRISVPVAKAGISVIGVDASAGMLEVAREYAAAEGVALDLRQGDMREPPVEERVPLVLIPFRSLLHMTTESRPAARAGRGARAARSPAAASSSTSSLPAATTSRTRTAAGSSASPASSSGPTGTRANGR